jgi:hypothetical protein
VSAGAYDHGEAKMKNLDENERDTYDDYSEEAILERDPAFRLSGGTDHEGPTVESVSAAVRQDLARCLEQLGMSPSRAAAVASL